MFRCRRSIACIMLAGIGQGQFGRFNIEVTGYRFLIMYLMYLCTKQMYFCVNHRHDRDQRFFSL